MEDNASWRVLDRQVEEEEEEEEKEEDEKGVILSTLHPVAPDTTHNTLIFFSVARSVGVRNWLGSLCYDSQSFSLSYRPRDTSLSTVYRTYCFKYFLFSFFFF